MRTFASFVALGVAGLTFFVAVWAVAPAPTLPLLALGVLVPEYAPWIAAACVVAGALAYASARGRVRRVALAVVTVAFVCTLVPIVEYPFARSAARRELDARFGDTSTSVASRPYAFAIRRDLPVVTRDGTRLGLDLYEPIAPGARATIVTIYGGAWIFGDPTQMAAIDRDYASRGYTVVAIDYRHAPAFHFPTQLHDVEDALATIARRAPAWHVDRRRVAIFGRSAGAELAVLAADVREPLDIRAVIAYYTPTDLTEGYRDPPVPDPANVRRILLTYVGKPPTQAADAYRQASPIAFVRPHFPPTLLIAGDRDELIRIAFQRRFRDALRACGDRVVAVEIPWSNHAFDEAPGGIGGAIATDVTHAFVDRVFAP